MIELLNRIWNSVTALLHAVTNHNSRLDKIESKLNDLIQVNNTQTDQLHDITLRLNRFSIQLETITSTLLISDATLDGMVDTLHDIREGVTAILAEVRPFPSARILFTFTSEDGEITTGDYMKITVTQKFSAAIQPVDKFNNPALIDGKPVWEASDPTIVSLVPSFDGLSVEVKAVGKIGTSQVSCTVDADLGSGITPITDKFQVDVTAGQAVGLGIVIGEAVEQDVITTA